MVHQMYIKFILSKQFVSITFFLCPGKLVTHLLINPPCSTPSGFTMAHVEAKNHEKTVDSPQLVLSKDKCWLFSDNVR